MAVNTLFVQRGGLALANAGHDCSPCARHLKVILHRKNWTNLLVYKH